jgi:hypothetical protein
MPENQRRILEMLKEGKITVEEAERLLSLTSSEASKGDTLSGAGTEKKRSLKYLRVVVTPDPERSTGSQPERVNIRVPVNLIRAGMKFSSLIPPQAADKVHDALKEKGVDFDLRNLKEGDIEELMTALSDLEVDIDGNQGEKVRVFVE